MAELPAGSRGSDANGRCEASFLQGPSGRRLFSTFRLPHGAVRGCVLHVAGFAEEMNKSRRMIAEGGRALAEAGFAVQQVDLSGCGDSSGDFADASWSDWVDDVESAARGLQSRVQAPLWLWGLRTGCLLAAQASERLPHVAGHLFWQPVTSGKSALQQFLRLKMAASLQEPGSRGVIEECRKALAAGEWVEVAGYRLPPAIAAGLESASLSPPATAAPSVWLEVSARPDDGPLPATSAAMARWQAAGHVTRYAAVQGPAFWQSVWMEHAPELIAATRTLLAESGSP